MVVIRLLVTASEAGRAASTGSPGVTLERSLKILIRQPLMLWKKVPRDERQQGSADGVAGGIMPLGIVGVHVHQMRCRKL